MKKFIIYPFFVLMLLVSCNQNNKVSSPSDSIVINSQYQQESEAYDLLNTQCYICHSINSTSHEAIIAPPMFAVKKRYLRIYDTKEEFVNAIEKWALNPNKENAIMRGAVSQFNVMPKQIFKEDDIRKIATYIYESNLEKPAWFEEHEREMHGGKRNGMGMKN